MNNSNVAFGIGFFCLSVLIGILLFHVYTQPSNPPILKSNTKESIKPSIQISSGVLSYTQNLNATTTQISPAIVKKNSLLTDPSNRKKTLPQAPMVNGLPCITNVYDGSETTIDGGNVNPPIQYAEISTSNIFSTVYRRDMNGSISLNGLNDFLLYPGDQKQLVVVPNTIYYIRFFNGLANTSGYSPVTQFSFKNCSS